MLAKYFLILTCFFLLGQGWIRSIQSYAPQKAIYAKTATICRLSSLQASYHNQVIAQYQSDLKDLQGKPELVDFLINLESKYPGIAKNINLYRSIYRFPLDSFQEQSLQSLLDGENVLVTTPTGSGKTVVGELAIYFALMTGLRIAYTTPLKALSNQKFHDFQQRFGHERVGLLTGDFVIHRDATVMIMTTEIFRNVLYDVQSAAVEEVFATTNVTASNETSNCITSLEVSNNTSSDRYGESVTRNAKQLLSNLFLVCFDEFHYMNDAERGTVWEESIIACPLNIRILALSATMGNAQDLQSWMSSIHGKTALIQSDFRPVPLRYYYGMKSLVLPLFAHPHAGPGSLLSQSYYNSSALMAMKLQKPMAAKVMKNPTVLHPGIKTHIANVRAKLQASLKLTQKGKKGKKTPRMTTKNDAKSSDGLIPTHSEIATYLHQRDKLPVIFFIFSRKACETSAMAMKKALASSGIQLLNAAEVHEVNSALVNFMQRNPMIPVKKQHIQLLQAGICIHHAGLLNIWKEFIEKLFNENKIKVLFATETLAAGVNMPARTTVITAVTKVMQSQVVKLKTSQLLQMAGRAGRRGKDTEGHVIVMQNEQDELQLSRSLLLSKVDAIDSHFQLSYKLILQLLHQKSLLDCRLLLERCFSTFMEQVHIQEKSLQNLTSSIPSHPNQPETMKTMQQSLPQAEPTARHEEVTKEMQPKDAQITESVEKSDSAVEDLNQALSTFSFTPKDKEFYYKVFLRYPMITVKDYLMLVVQFQKAMEQYAFQYLQLQQAQLDLLQHKLQQANKGQLVQLKNQQQGYYLGTIQFSPQTGEIVCKQDLITTPSDVLSPTTSGYLLLSTTGKYLIVELQDILSLLDQKEMEREEEDGEDGDVVLTCEEGEQLAQYFHEQRESFTSSQVSFLPVDTITLPSVSNHTLIRLLSSDVTTSSSNDTTKTATGKSRKRQKVEYRKIWTFASKEKKATLIRSWKLLSKNSTTSSASSSTSSSLLLSTNCQNLLLRAKSRTKKSVLMEATSSTSDDDLSPVDNEKVEDDVERNKDVSLSDLLITNESLRNQTQLIHELERKIVDHEITNHHAPEELYKALQFLISKSSFDLLSSSPSGTASLLPGESDAIQEAEEEEDEDEDEDEEGEDKGIESISEETVGSNSQAEEDATKTAIARTIAQEDIHVWQQFQSMIHFLLTQKALMFKGTKPDQIPHKRLRTAVKNVVRQQLPEDGQPFYVTPLGRLATRLIGGENELWMAMMLTHPEVVQGFESHQYQASHLAALVSMLFCAEYRASRIQVTIKPSKEVMNITNTLLPLQKSLQDTQKSFDLEYPVSLSYQISGLTEAWCRNMSWYDLTMSTSLDQGDLSRIFLRTLTSLSQIAACPETLLSPAIISLAKEAVTLMHRFPIHYFDSEVVLSSVSADLQQSILGNVSAEPIQHVEVPYEPPSLTAASRLIDRDIPLDVLFELVDSVEKGSVDINSIQTKLSLFPTSPSTSKFKKRTTRDWKPQYVTLETLPEFLPPRFMESLANSSSVLNGNSEDTEDLFEEVEYDDDRLLQTENED